MSDNMPTFEYALENFHDNPVEQAKIVDWLSEPFGHSSSFSYVESRAGEINRYRQESNKFGDLPSGTLVRVVKREVLYGPWESAKTRLMTSNGLKKVTE